MAVFSPRFGWFAVTQIPNRLHKCTELAILIVLDTLFVFQLAAITELELVKVGSSPGNPTKSSCCEWFLIGFTAIFVRQKNKNDFFRFDYAHWIRSEMTSNRFLQSRKCISRCVAFLFFWFSILYSHNLDFTAFTCRCFTAWPNTALCTHAIQQNHIFWEYKFENQKNKNATHLEIHFLECRNRLEVISLLTQWA